jgi:hypothetical protein
MTDEKLIEEAKKRFAKSVEAEAENRKNWIDDVQFYSGEQWPTEIRKSREIDSRPCLTVNRLPQFVRQVTNDQRQNRPSIKIRPADDNADPETAEILQGLVRHIESNSNADQAYDNAFFYAVTGSFGYFRIVTDYASDNSFEQEIFIRRIANPLSVYGDADSNEPDGSDWNYCFVVEEVPSEQFEAEHGKETVADWDQGSGSDGGWVTKEVVRVAEYYYVETQKVKIYLHADGSVSEEPGADPMFPDLDSREVSKRVVKWAKIGGDKVLDKTDLPGTYIPVIPVYGDEVIIDGKKELISLIRFAKDPQRMLNYWRSTETELVALQPKAPFVVAEGQLEGYEGEWKQANTKNFAYLTYNPVDVNGNQVPAPQRQGFAAPPSGVLQGALNAESDLKSVTGIYDASLGAKSNETSGKAILARQKEGDVSTFHFIDNMTRAIRQAGRILVQYIPAIYDTPRVVRILGEDGTEEMRQVNQPVIEKDEQGNPVERIYDLGLGTYDVVCAAGPSYSTQRQEAAASMQAILQAAPQLMQVAGDLLVKNLDWPGADELAERLKKTIPPELQDEEEQQIPPQVQQAMQQMEQAIQQREQMIQQLMQELQSLKAQEGNDQAKVAIDAKKVEIDAYKAETDRLKVELEAQAAQQVIPQEPQQTVQEQGIDLSPIVQMLQQLEQRISQPQQPIVINTGAATRKQARAVKQPDGSWAMESVEVPEEGI